MMSPRLLPLALATALVLAACSTKEGVVPSTGGPTVAATSVGAPSAALPSASLTSPAYSGSPALPAIRSDPTQTSEGGQVTATVTWTGGPTAMSFEVKLDTHSVDLGGLDLSSAILRNDRGATLSARPWSAPAGTHHRTGQLDFDGDAAGFLAGSTWIELVLPNVGDPPVPPLRWALSR